MQPGWQERALVWLALAESVRANRRAYPTLPTAWLPHGMGNTLALWLPELLAALDSALAVGEHCPPDSTLAALYRTAQQLCIGNERWGHYVAPAALGYILSHPNFNIYKGKMGELQLLGFGLDAIPHSTTAFALSRLLQDSIGTLAAFMPPRSPLAPLVRGLGRRPALFSAAILCLLTVVWERGEYQMQQEELRRTGGDRSAINMEWDPRDTFYDVLSNLTGWAIAASQQGHLPAAPFAPAAPTD